MHRRRRCDVMCNGSIPGPQPSPAGLNNILFILFIYIINLDSIYPMQISIKSFIFIQTREQRMILAE
jgi:hypothetical protein